MTVGDILDAIAAHEAAGHKKTAICNVALRQMCASLMSEGSNDHRRISPDPAAARPLEMACAGNEP
jgi:hypothetical protein